MAFVCENFPERHISKENFMDIQRAIGRIVNELLEEGFTHRQVDTYLEKGAANMVSHDEITKDW